MSLQDFRTANSRQKTRFSRNDWRSIYTRSLEKLFLTAKKRNIACIFRLLILTRLPMRRLFLSTFIIKFILQSSYLITALF